jgi:hypothetical protein
MKSNVTSTDDQAAAWTEFAARHVYAMARNGKECKNPSRSLVAATFEKTKAYVFTEMVVMKRNLGQP